MNSQMKILVVEDDREAANWLIKGLKEEGHVVDLATNGIDGLDMAGEQAHDVIVMDRMLPGMDGLSVISKLREDGVSTPVLILSALG
jgi:two-component system OmpR family response regulator